HRTGHGTPIRARDVAPAPATRHERARPGPAPNPPAGRPHTLVRVNRTTSRSARQRREPGPQAPPAATPPRPATPAPAATRTHNHSDSGAPPHSSGPSGFIRSGGALS